MHSIKAISFKNLCPYLQFNYTKHKLRIMRLSRDCNRRSEQLSRRWHLKVHVRYLGLGPFVETSYASYGYTAWTNNTDTSGSLLVVENWTWYSIFEIKFESIEAQGGCNRMHINLALARRQSRLTFLHTRTSCHTRTHMMFACTWWGWPEAGCTTSY